MRSREEQSRAPSHTRCAFEAAARAHDIATAAATAAPAAHATIQETAALVFAQKTVTAASEAAAEHVNSAIDDAALAVSTASNAADASDKTVMSEKEERSETEYNAHYDSYVKDRNDWCEAMKRRSIARRGDWGSH